jgi:hypothetical protein
MLWYGCCSRLVPHEFQVFRVLNSCRTICCAAWVLVMFLNDVVVLYLNTCCDITIGAQLYRRFSAHAFGAVMEPACI